MADQSNQPGGGPIHSDFASDPDMKELVELFLRELPQRIESINVAFRDGDTATLTRLTHQLRGASAGYGFPSLGSVAGDIEDSLRTLGNTAAPLTLAKVSAEVNTLIDLCRRACAA